MNKAGLLVPHLAAIVVIAGCIGLMHWQFERAEYKQQWIDRWTQRDPVRLESLRPPYDLPQPVMATGHFDASRQILLDNQIRDRRMGVFVLTPWRATDGRLFLVNRGWASWPTRSEPLPKPAVPTASGPVYGVLNSPPDVGARLGRAAAIDDRAGWPKLVTYFDIDRIRAVLGQELQPLVIQLDPDHPAHLTGDRWKIVTFGPERHQGYAWTWASIAIVVALIWLTLTVRLLRSRKS
ncbi:MAG: SURF1 family protein [Xanthomonadaceae bacterium]|nr:SURF1 family protein [Xanthomonadaceae bacterium]